MKNLTSIMKNIIFLGLTISISLLICSQETYGLQITEIMFNPEGADTGREWIELHLNSSEGCMNLTGYKLFEENTNHNIYPLDEEIFCEHAIICNDMDRFLQEYPYMNLTLEERANTIIFRSSFSLSNSGEDLAIKKDAQIVEYINYSVLLGFITVEEGYSLELIDNTWKRSSSLGGSPVENNNSDTSVIDPTDHTESTTITNSTIDVNATTNNNNNNNNNNTVHPITNATSNISTYDNTSDYEDSILNESIVDDSIINNTLNANDTIDTNSSSQDGQQSNTDTQQENQNISGQNLRGCNVSLSIKLKNDSLNVPYINGNDVQIKFYNRLEFHNNISAMNYSIEYWVEDIAGNILKNRMITSNQDEKSFTPKIDETDRIIFIKGNIKNIDCDITRGFDERILLIQNKGYSVQNCPACDCKITKCSPCTGKTSCITEDICQEMCLKKDISAIPSIKIVNVCNDSEKTHPDGTKTSNITQTQLKENSLGITTTDALSDNNSKKSIDKGMTTGMIIYESPNIKNRFYAIVGLMLVGLTLIIITAYKLRTRYVRV